VSVVFLSSFKSVLAQLFLVGDLKLDSLELLCYMAPLSFVQMTGYAYALGEHEVWYEDCYYLPTLALSDWATTLPTDEARRWVGLLLSNGLLAWALNVSFQFARLIWLPDSKLCHHEKNLSCDCDRSRKFEARGDYRVECHSFPNASVDVKFYRICMYFVICFNTKLITIIGGAWYSYIDLQMVKEPKPVTV
jgi:hypothetical protein